MKPSASTPTRILIVMVFGVYLVPTLYPFEFGGVNDVAAVSGRTGDDYVRARLEDGSFKAESYVFGKGGVWKGTMQDSTTDKLNFLEIAHVIAGPLADQNYIPSVDPNTTRLLIMVYWGTTHAPEHASNSAEYENLQISPNDPGKVAAVVAENQMRENDDKLNAMILGYDSWWGESSGDFRGTALDLRRRDLLDELEQNRYFVVLMAYDFHLMWKEKKHKLLWETRFSIRQRYHDFGKDLPSMAQYASQYFGQDSKGLVQKPIPLGHVDVGEVKSLGEVPPPQVPTTGNLPKGH